MLNLVTGFTRDCSGITRRQFLQRTRWVRVKMPGENAAPGKDKEPPRDDFDRRSAWFLVNGDIAPGRRCARKRHVALPAEGSAYEP